MGQGQGSTAEVVVGTWAGERDNVTTWERDPKARKKISMLQVRAKVETKAKVGPEPLPGSKQN